jgi:hypothetical protein
MQPVCLFAAPNTLRLLTLTEDLIRASGDRLLLCASKRFDTFYRDKTKFPAASKSDSCATIFKPFLPASNALKLLKGAIHVTTLAARAKRPLRLAAAPLAAKKQKSLAGNVVRQE